MSQAPPTPSHRRRWWKALAVVVIAGLGLLAALPTLIAVGPFRARVNEGLARALAPGGIEFGPLHLSWFGPTRLDRVSLLDPKGRAVLQAPSITIDRTLGQLILKDRSPLTLTVLRGELRVERSLDGSIDLADALRTVLATPDPRRDVTIRLQGGTIAYHDPFLAEPLDADALDLTIHAPYAPGPVTWLAKLGKGDSSLELQGEFDTWLSKGGPPQSPELTIGVVSKRWPIVARTAGVNAFGRLDGSLDFARKRGRWALTGDARLEGFGARGKPLDGESLAFDRLEAGWDLAQGEQGWTIRRLSATCPLGRVRAEGRLDGPGGSGKQRIEATIDLAEVARQLPKALHIRDGLVVERGTAKVDIDLESTLDRLTCDLEARLSDLAARDADRPLSLKDPATITARLVRESDQSRVERFAVQTSFLDLSAQGEASKGIALTGSADLAGLRRQLGQWVDLGGLDLAGRAEISGNYTVLMTGSTPIQNSTLAATVKDLRVEGTGLGPIRRDTARFEVKSSGASDHSGVPGPWTTLGLVAQSGASTIQIDLNRSDPTTRLVASAGVPWAIGDRTRPARLDLVGQWSPDRKTLVFDLVRAIVEPTDRGAPEARIILAAKGSFDAAKGEITLDRDPAAPAGSWGIDAEGWRASGLGRGLEALRFEGGVTGDAEGLDALLADATGRKPLGASGRWVALANGRGDSDGLTVTGRFALAEPPAAGLQSTRPNALTLQAHYASQADRVDLTEFTVSTPFGTLDASGTLEAASSKRRIDVKGTLAPDFAAINARLAAKVEPGARVDGKPRGFRAVGPIGDPGGWKGLDAEVGFDLSGADVYGMKFGPSPVVLRASRGVLSFDRIATTLNDGHVRLEPEIDLDSPAGPVLRLAKNSHIREARINDEVSKRVLAYVAPILDQATRASGLVSVDLDHAEFPLGPGRSRQAKVEGAVVFRDVQFGPGPLAAEILGAIGRPELALKLDQPVTLTIADGRVNQRGMTVPIGDLTRVELNGWVDFDRNLALNATLPVTPAMLGNNPLLSDLVGNARVRLPITGTLDRPKIDQEAFAANLQDLGKSLLTRGATRGALELLMRLGRPKDPDAPPPPPRPSAAERKAIRQEKKAIRRGEVPAQPPAEAPPRP